MQIVAISIHPKFIEAYMAFGVFRSAQASGAASFRAIDLRDFAVDTHASIDGAPYGGGDGMVLRPEPLRDALNSISTDRGSLHVVMPSPGGRLFTQSDAVRFSRFAGLDTPKTLVFVCGRFAGIDQRFIDKYVDEEISAGDFILSGGELPALSMIDATLRLLPGVLGNPTSASCDSFGEGMGGILEFPNYTRPPEFEGLKVPEELMSGDHRKIENWRKAQSVLRTQKLRPDLLADLKK